MRLILCNKIKSFRNQHLSRSADVLPNLSLDNFGLMRRHFCHDFKNLCIRWVWSRLKYIEFWTLFAKISPKVVFFSSNGWHPIIEYFFDFLPKKYKHVSKINILLAFKIEKILDYKEWFDRLFSQIAPYYRVLFALFRPKINVRYFLAFYFIFLRKRGIISFVLRGEGDGCFGAYPITIPPPSPCLKKSFQIAPYYPP